MGHLANVPCPVSPLAGGDIMGHNGTFIKILPLTTRPFAGLHPSHKARIRPPETVERN